MVGRYNVIVEMSLQHNGVYKYR